MFQEKIVNDSTVTLTDLETGHFYNIFVVSRNEHGTSLPTAILLVNITNMGELFFSHSLSEFLHFPSVYETYLGNIICKILI